MKTYGYYPRGGNDGIQVTTEELSEYARISCSKYIDETIPLPDKDPIEQVMVTKECIHPEDEYPIDTIYWESETGNHGWCCSKCGTVIQWG